MKNTLTVSEVQEAKDKAEAEITTILNELQKRTGLRCVELGIRTLPIYHGIVNVEAQIKLYI